MNLPNTDATNLPIVVLDNCPICYLQKPCSQKKNQTKRLPDSEQKPRCCGEIPHPRAGCRYCRYRYSAAERLKKRSESECERTQVRCNQPTKPAVRLLGVKDLPYLTYLPQPQPIRPNSPLAARKENDCLALGRTGKRRSSLNILPNRNRSRSEKKGQMNWPLFRSIAK